MLYRTLPFSHITPTLSSLYQADPLACGVLAPKRAFVMLMFIIFKKLYLKLLRFHFDSLDESIRYNGFCSSEFNVKVRLLPVDVTHQYCHYLWCDNRSVLAIFHSPLFSHRLPIGSFRVLTAFQK